ncbi:MAG: UDP-glucose dehydrogenase family protein [Nocardioides sp.]
MRVTVIGCGYLGATHAASMAELGFEVLGMEIDPAKRDALTAGKVPFYEPDLQELLTTHVESGRLRFTDDYRQAAEFGDVHFLCVGTPQVAEGMGADLSQARAAIQGLAPHLTRPALVVGKSTVPVGTAPELATMLADLAPVGTEAELAWNPEFLREGFAVSDTLRPDRLVIGVTSEAAERTMRGVYADTIAAGTPVVVTDFATAELAKVAANAFLATKISFINAVAEVCEVTGADIVDLADSLGHDERIGRKFLNAGVGCGGGCLPKDIRAFIHRAGELGAEGAMSLLSQVDDINQGRREHAVKVATSMLGGSLAQARVAVWGAAFKPDTDDVRDSPALWIAGQLHLRGADVSVYDPKANDTARQMFPTLTYASDAVSCVRDADLLLHLTAWPEFAQVDPAALLGEVRRPLLLDGGNCLDFDAWRAAGWTVRGLGRR